MNKKLIWGIIGIIAIASAIIGAYLFIVKYKPCGQNCGPISQLETKDWKVYTNEEYGFEFKYPSDWIINGDRFGEECGCFFLDLDRQNREVNSVKEPILGLRIYYGQEDLNSFLTSYNPKGEQKSIKISGVSAAQTSLIGQNGKLGIFVGFVKSKNGFTFSSFDSEGDETVVLANQILSTFKFTEQNQTNIETKDWKTYKNEKYGFEIGYPQNYKFQEQPDSVSLVGFYNSASSDTSEGLGTKIYFYHDNFSTFDEFVSDKKANYIASLVKSNNWRATDEEVKQEVKKMEGRYSFETKKINGADVLVHKRDFFGIIDGAVETYIWIGNGDYLLIYGSDLDIDSFKFTQQNQTSDETKDWKTYEDEYLTIKYPADWHAGVSYKWGDSLPIEFCPPSLVNSDPYAGAPCKMTTDDLKSLAPIYISGRELRLTDEKYRDTYTTMSTTLKFIK